MQLGDDLLGVRRVLDLLDSAGGEALDAYVAIGITRPAFAADDDYVASIDQPLQGALERPLA